MAATSEEKLAIIRQHIQSYPDFPAKNVVFRDIFSVLQHPQVFALLRDVLLEHVQTLEFDCIVALDSRGFLFGPIVALQFQKPFVPIRKKGKLPGNTKSVSYKLEYGQDAFEMQADSIKRGDRVLLIDDLLATGGSMAASCELIRLFGGIVVECLVIMELIELNGRTKLKENVHSFIQY